MRNHRRRPKHGQQRNIGKSDELTIILRGPSNARHSKGEIIVIDGVRYELTDDVVIPRGGRIPAPVKLAS